jgi:RNA polymerase-interacting CarD/CdnL/TRCF family regulator
VDDLVVYASHGVGRVAIRQQETVVLEFADGLSVTLPIERAVECVRPVSSEVEIASIGRTLGGADTVSQESWQSRLKSTRGKLTGGEAAGLAEVIRDARRRDERATARKEPGRLSLTERQFFT